jgi:hypothetical protein
MKLIGLLIFLSVEIIFSIGFGFSAAVNFLIEMNEFESSTLITTTTTINTIDTMSINIESSDVTTSNIITSTLTTTSHIQHYASIFDFTASIVTTKKPLNRCKRIVQKKTLKINLD